MSRIRSAQAPAPAPAAMSAARTGAESIIHGWQHRQNVRLVWKARKSRSYRYSFRSRISVSLACWAAVSVFLMRTISEICAFLTSRSRLRMRST